MESVFITSWQIEGEEVEAVTVFLFLGSKVTEDGDCSHEMRRWLLLCRKAMTNLYSVEKQGHYSASKGPYSQGYGLLSGCVELWGWTIKKAECQRIDAFKLWCWRFLWFLRTPWTAKRSNQSVLRKTNLDYSLERLTLTLKLQYFGHLIQTTTSLEKSLMMGKITSRRRGWDGLMASPIQWTWTWAYFGRWWRQGGLVCISPSGHKESDTTGQLSNNLFCHEHWGVCIFKS